jgi:integrase
MTQQTVFINTRSNEPLTVDGLKANFKHLAKSSGIPFTAHDIRRGAATHAIRSGMPSRVAQLQGEWSSLAMLEHCTATLGPDDVQPLLEAEEIERRPVTAASPERRGAFRTRSVSQEAYRPSAPGGT